MLFIIEHLEDDVHDWCLLEYRHMSKVVGPTNLWFTNVQKGGEKLAGLGKVVAESVTTLGLKNICLLDLVAPRELQAVDGKEFEYFVFGGILGDHPPRGRTRKLRETLQAPTRHLGDRQMSTDTAVLVTKMILEGTPLANISFVDDITIPTGEGEEVQLPYRYVLKDGMPVLPEGMIEHLKKDEF